MTPEIAFAKALGELPTKNKLASAMEKLSIEQLEQLLRSEGFQRAPLQTLEEKTAAADAYGRQLAQEGIADLEASLEKEAFVDQVVGGLVGHEYGRQQKERGERHSFGVPQAAASLLLPGGAGYQVGRYMAHQNKGIKSGKKKTSAERLHEATAEIVKQAETETERAHKWGKRGAIGLGAYGLGSTALGVAKSPELRGMLKKHPGAAVLGAGIGTGLNAGIGYGGGRLAHQVIHGPATNKKVKTSAERLYEATAEVVKQAGVPVGALQKGIGQAAGAIMKSPLAARAAVGAAGGAAGGAIASKDNRLGGALAGGLAGGALGAAAKPAVHALKQAPGATGKYLRQGLRSNVNISRYRGPMTPA